VEKREEYRKGGREGGRGGRKEECKRRKGKTRN
jgi:hypothetical protein